MGLFNFFKKKRGVSEETRQKFLDSILEKYFASSKVVLQKDVSDLLELTKYSVTDNELAILLIRCLGFRELKGGLNKQTAEALRNDCSGKLPDEELKWLLVYCDVHYIQKDSKKEMLLIAELGGRQIGMPSPLGQLSANYKFDN